jgi:hypothetical protein
MSLFHCQEIGIISLLKGEASCQSKYKRKYNHSQGKKSQ